jgi:hypothetical protein
MTGRDDHPSSNVKALTAAGIVERAIHPTWLILNRSEFIWDGKIRATPFFGLIADRRRNDSQTMRR